MALVARNDEAAVGRLYRRLSCFVDQQARAWGVEADDVKQDLMIALWRSAERYDAGQTKLITWAACILRNLIVSRLRKAKVRGRPDRLTDYSWVATARLEHLPDVPKAFPPEKMAEVLRLHFERGLTLVQVSRSLGRAEGTVKSQYVRGLAAYRENARA
jgi:RNA polymerase sigma-70 factor (ECF subfamily)